MFDILNIDVDAKRTSIMQPLCLFYLCLLVSKNELLSKQTKTYIEENRLFQHVLAFLLLAVLLIVTTHVTFPVSILYASVIYIFFIFSTKLDLHWSMIIMTLLFVGTVYDNEMYNREQNMLKDNNLDKNTIIEQQNNIRKHLMYMALFGGVVIMTGTILYAYKKEGQYGGSYNTTTYLFF